MPVLEDPNDSFLESVLCDGSYTIEQAKLIADIESSFAGPPKVEPKIEPKRIPPSAPP